MARQNRAARDGGDRTNLYDEITAKIINELERGRLPWVQPWGTAAKARLAMPRNAATARQYSGINILILWGAVVQYGYPTQHWLTFRQALSLGGNVRKGERGTTVVYADRFTPEDEKRRARETGEEAGSIPFLKRFPATDEIVMVAGTPPIRAKKARYYEDRRFTERVLPPPELVSPAPRQSDDWSALSLPVSRGSTIEAVMIDDEDPTQSEHRQQPELSRVNPVEKRVPIENEFDPLSYDGSDDETARSQRLTRVMRGIARQVSMDPGDGMEL